LLEIDRVGRSQKDAAPSRPLLLSQAVVMASSADSEASKKDGAQVPSATDRVQGGALPAFFTEDSLLRLEAGLRAQREQQDGRRSFEPDAASSQPGNSGALRDRLSVSAEVEPINENAPLVEPISENAPLAPGAEQSKILKEEPVPLPSWRRRRVALLLSALLLVVGAAALGVSLKTRTGGSTDAAPVNSEGRGRTAAARNNDETRQPITNGVRSSASTPSLPPLAPAAPNQRPVEAQAPSTPAASKTPAPTNERPVEAQRAAMPAASGTPEPKPQCNVSACRRVYRSFRASDCTFQPYSHGRRQICTR
jgi:hypothetical protein